VSAESVDYQIALLLKAFDLPMMFPDFDGKFGSAFLTDVSISPLRFLG
jgi:hypothetical protein